MTTYSDLKSKALALLGDAAQLARSRQESSATATLTETADRLSAEKLFLVVCGEFKRGKSKLINALLGEPHLCPVGIHVTTAAVTTIAYAPSEQVTVLLGPPGTTPRQERITRDRVPDYVSEQHNPDSSRSVRLLSIETPNQSLQSGLVVVDTPGVGGVYAEHSDVTYAFLPNADVVLFVGDALSPLSTKELEFAALAGRHCQHLIHAVTKVDGDAAYEAATVMATNRQKLAKALGRPESDIPVVGVSSNCRLAYLTSHDPMDLEDSHFPELEREIWKHLGENRGWVLIGAAVGRLVRVLGDLRAPLAAGLEAVEADTKKALDELEARWKATSDRLGELQSRNAAWRVMLSDRLDDLATAARDRLANGFATIRAEADRRLAQDEFLDAPARLIDRLQVEVNALTASITAELKSGAAQVLGEVEESTRLQLHAVNVGQIRATGGAAAQFGEVSKTGWWQAALQMGRQAMSSGTTGATLAGLIGGAIGGALGFLAGGVGAAPGAIIGAKLGAILGGVSGLATGARTAVGQVAAQDRAVARREIAPVVTRFLDDCHRPAVAELSAALKAVQRAMRDDLEGQIQAERKVCEETLAAVAQARKLAPAEAATRAARLRAELAPIDALLGRAAELTVAISEPTSMAPPAGAVPLELPTPTAPAFGSWADA